MESAIFCISALVLDRSVTKRVQGEPGAHTVLVCCSRSMISMRPAWNACGNCIATQEVLERTGLHGAFCQAAFFPTDREAVAVFSR